MCDNWKPKYFDKYSCDGSITYAGEGELIVEGTLKENISGTKIAFWAANPPDYRQSFTGSGLPFANPEMAYENTENKGLVEADSYGKFKFRLRLPNSYYVGLGTIHKSPHVHIKIKNDVRETIHSVDLNGAIPFRMLTYPSPPHTVPRCSPMFYNHRNKLPIRTQEQILRDSAYPSTNKMPDNFWGLAVPHA